jgi:cellulose biosynthesis protein BcsQ
VNPPIITFFYNKGGVGKTTLVYHLAWMFSDSGSRVLVADLDPQANLTASFLFEDTLEEVLNPGPESGRNKTIYQCLQPLIDGLGDISLPAALEVGPRLSLVAGDLALSQFEDTLGTAWLQIGTRSHREFRVTTAFSRILKRTAREAEADLVLLDLAPSLGALNRSALIAADYVITPLTADLYSLQGLRNVGAAFARWRGEWDARRAANLEVKIEDVPEGRMTPIGYVLHQHSERRERPVKAYGKWIDRIPHAYAEHIRGQPMPLDVRAESDPDCLGLVKNYRSLVPMAMEARNPIFHLKAADGALGAHFRATQAAGANFRDVAKRIEEAIRLQEAPLLNPPC